MIDGVRIKELVVIPDERGRLMEILRSDDDGFVTTGYLVSVGAMHRAIGIMRGAALASEDPQQEDAE